jgi:uncharacterized protein with HEPN domain
MPPRGWRFRINDILAAIDAVQAYTRGMDFASFVADRKAVHAVIHNLTVIGEAACHLPDDLLFEHPKIPWRDMRDMRNFIVHEYFGISDRIIWDTVQNNLPPLIPMLKSLLPSTEGSPQ